MYFPFCSHRFEVLWQRGWLWFAKEYSSQSSTNKSFNLQNGANLTIYDRIQLQLTRKVISRALTYLIEITTQKSFLLQLIFYRNNYTVIKLQSKHRKTALVLPSPCSLILSKRSSFSCWTDSSLLIWFCPLQASCVFKDSAILWLQALLQDQCNLSERSFCAIYYKISFTANFYPTRFDGSCMCYWR